MTTMSDNDPAPVKKPRQPNFGDAENELLSRCWLECSSDATIGTNQDGPSFWRSVYQKFVKESLPDALEHSQRFERNVFV